MSSGNLLTYGIDVIANGSKYMMSMGLDSGVTSIIAAFGTVQSPGRTGAVTSPKSTGTVNSPKTTGTVMSDRQGNS